MTRVAFNRSTPRKVGTCPRTGVLTRVMPQLASDTARGQWGRQRYLLTLARAPSSPVRGSGVSPPSPAVRAMTVKIPLEINELHLQIRRRPEQRPVETFAANRSDQAFDEDATSGTDGTVLIASTSRIRRFACHWWNRYSGS